jgi:AraC-like DNA-binding protein
MDSGQKLNNACGYISANDSDSVSAAFVIGLIKAAGSCNVVSSDALADLGCSIQQLDDPLARIPYASLIVLLDKLSQLTNFQRELGVEIGRRLMPGSFSALGYAAASCNTLGEAIETIPSYENVALTAGRTELHISGDGAQLSWTTTDQSHSFLLEEIILSAWLQLAQNITDTQSLPIRVMFTGPEPENRDRFTAFFGNEIIFGQPKACVLFHASLLHTPIIHSDSFINNLMTAQAVHIHQSLYVASLLTDAVTELIRQRLAEGDFGQETVASTLCLSVRTLRRRLKEEETCYQTILDSVRREQSRDYLGDQTLSIYAVAMQLGYSEHSAFSAAFKRWFGISPLAFRETVG